MEGIGGGLHTTYAKADDEKSDGEESDLERSVEFFGDAFDAGGDDGGCECNGEADETDGHGDGPFPPLRPVLRVRWIAL